jgi:2,3-diketo-5-methylthio-1-phosphopentane phosphatase
MRADIATTSLILDFDGTITHADVGDEICDRFADPRWRELDERWERKEIALPDAQREMWALVAAPAEAILAYAHEIGRIRPGLDALLDAAAGFELVLASGGFDFYIEAILGARLGRFAAVYCNRGVLGGGGVQVSFPLRASLGCELCAVCKGRICAERRRAGRRVIFVGDGTSDRCAIGQADELWAVRGGKLARAAAGRAREFDGFDEIAAAL